jgi:hypothetical protein
VATDRPADEEYYEQHRVELFSQGDIFRDVPVGYPTILEEREGEGAADQEHREWLAAGTRRFLSGPLDVGFAMLITPSCSMGAQGGGAGYAHPVRTLVVVRTMSSLVEDGILREAQIDAMRSRDRLVNYMYLPATPDGELPESAALLYYPVTLHHDFLEGQRVTQLAYEGARQLQRKLGAFFAGFDVERDELDPPMD